MRNKTLLIRRHLIHYWHLSNQTTFHKTLFSHSDDEDRKIEHGKYASCLLTGILSRFGGVRGKRKTIFPCLSLKVFQSKSKRNLFSTSEWRESLEMYAENCSELRISRKNLPTPFQSAGSKSFLFRFTIENVDRRTHSPRLIFIHVLFFCTAFQINLSSLISNEK